MSWEKETDEIRRRRALARRQGGEEAVARQHAKGRLTLRERIAGLADAASFRELGEGAGVPHFDADGNLVDFEPANYVLGFATIGGRRVAIGGEDFTLKGGSPNPAGLRKSVYAEELALTYKVPLIRLHEGGGGSVAGSGAKGNTRPLGEPVFADPRFRSIAQVLGEVPVAAAALGPVAGMPAARLVASHFSVMVENAQVLIAGRKVVARALNEDLTKEELGGPDVHARSGVIDNVAKTEEEALAEIARFLSYLPDNVWQLPPRAECTDPRDRAEENLLSIVPKDGRTPYKPRRIIEAAVDQGSFFEIGHDWGRGIVTGLARIDGYAVGILAGDPFFLDGAWTADVCDKVTRHMDLCSTFHLPVVHFVDCPGFAVGVKAETAGVTRAGVRAMTAVYQADVPVCSVVIRKAYGLAGSVMMNQSKTKWRYCWPSGDWGSLPMAGGIEAAFRKELSEADNPEELKAQLYRKFEAIRSPFRTAESFLAEEIIDPRDTRALLIDYIHHAQRVLAPGERRVTFRP